MSADRVREIFDREIAQKERGGDSPYWFDSWFKELRDEVVAAAASESCGLDGGHSDQPGHKHTCARPVDHPLTDIPVEGAAIESSHRCSCGEVWCDGKDVIMG